MDIQGMFFSTWELDSKGNGANVRASFLNIRKPANEGQGYKALNRHRGQNGAGVKAREDLMASIIRMKSLLRSSRIRSNP